MRVYNTMTRKKEEFKPLHEGKVNMYVCGPTVYNFFHIGNARPFVVFDTLRKYLIYKGYDVTFVQNFTDVDDKIINRAKEEGLTAMEVADKYIDEYYKDAGAINVKKADVHPRVSETMDDIIQFVADLIDMGYAYEVDGDVYYSTRKFKDYGKLSKQNIDDLEAGARIVRHLMSVGAKHIHFLICELCPMTFVNRLAGAESQLKLAGAKMPKGGNVLYAEADDLKALTRYLKRQSRRPDAFICSNDAIAAVFKQTLEKAGVRVPKDVMLTGFADLLVASLMTPTLTTVRQNREQMAQAAFRRLMDRIADPSLPPCDLFLPATLVARNSTKGGLP